VSQTTSQAQRPPSTAADVAALMERLLAPTTLRYNPDAEGVIAAPSGLQLHPIKKLMEPYRTFPERPRGHANFSALHSIIEWVNRQKLPESVLFACNDMAKPSITAVINYHDPRAVHEERAAGKAGYGDHRGVYHFPLSKAWKAWVNAEAASPMEQADFARFLEDHITDVLMPPAKDSEAPADRKILDLVAQLGGNLAGPTALLTLSRGLAVHETSVVKNAQNLDNGTTTFVYETTQTGENGQQLNVPNMFLIGVPVFEMGALYRIPVRLRYRLSGGRVKWSLMRHRPELTFEDAFDEALQEVRTKTELPLFIGSPETLNGSAS
jgi:hypothetical protein